MPTILDERCRAGAMRARAAELSLQSDRLSAQAAETLRTTCGPARGERGERFELRLARLRPTVGLLRHELRRWLERRGIDPSVATEVTLACSEACANAVEHPARPAEHAFEVVAVERDGELTLVVRDFGRWRATPSDGVRGRGLETIRALMDDVELVSDGGGTRVVMRRRVPRQVSSAASSPPRTETST
jgi:anti-sigma regulatory factor (Ser/Thr protein kinase)